MEKVYGKTKIDNCPLCLAEKLHLIEYFDDIRLLNKRGEFINHCRHQKKKQTKKQKKLLLKSFKKTMVWINTKYLYALVVCLVYFVFDIDIFLFIF